MLDVDVLSGRIVAAGTAPGSEDSNAHCSSQCLSGCGTEEGIRSNFRTVMCSFLDASAYFFQKPFKVALVLLMHASTYSTGID